MSSDNINDGRGRRMSVYGKIVLTPYEKAGLWKKVTKKENLFSQGYMEANARNRCKNPCLIPWSKAQLEEMKTSCYGKRKTDTVADTPTIYERLFDPHYSYDCKLHRDDRKNKMDIAKSIHEEESQRTIPVLSSSNYGHRINTKLEPFYRGHVRIDHVVNGFYNKRGTGLPPLDI